MASYVDGDGYISKKIIGFYGTIVVVPGEDVKKAKEQNGGNAWLTKQAGIYPISFDNIRREEQKGKDYITWETEENTSSRTDRIKNIPGYNTHPNYTNGDVIKTRETKATDVTIMREDSNNQ